MYLKQNKKLTDKELKDQWKRIKIKEGKIENRRKPLLFYKQVFTTCLYLQALDITLISKEI